MENLTTSYTIMVIDDDPDDLEITRRALIKIGCSEKCILISCAETALEVLQSRQDVPSLILLDFKMPGMTGIELLRRVRADGRLNKIPVVVITNSTLEAARIAALASGANGFLQKAFDLDSYAKDIQGMLKQWVK